MGIVGALEEERQMASRVTFYEVDGMAEDPGKHVLAEVRNAPIPPVGSEVLFAGAEEDERREVLGVTYRVQEFELESDDKWHAEVSILVGPPRGE